MTLFLKKLFKEDIVLYHVFLTQSGGLLGPIASVLGWILNGIYEFLDLFGIQNVGLVIILFTFISRGLMIPLTIKQQKFTKLSSKMNPEIQKIQAKYKGKKDEESLKKQQAETQAIYEKYGASPTAGCLPMLIQLPIMFALYRVIYNVPGYVNDIKILYSNVASAIIGTDGYIDIMTEFANNVSVKTGFFTDVTVDATYNSAYSNHIIDILAKFKSEQWIELVEKFPSIQNIIETNSQVILDINRFGSLNILDNPGIAFPAILVPILAAVLQFIQGKQIQSVNPSSSSSTDNPMGSTMSTMNNIMPIMSGVFCVMLPIGVGLYWVAGSLFAIAQQFIINKYMEKIDVETLIEKNVMKVNKKKAKMGIDPNASMNSLAKKHTKSIEVNTVDLDTEKTSTSNYANSVKKNYEPSNYKKSDVSHSSGSISANANLLKNKNSDKGDK